MSDRDFWERIEAATDRAIDMAKAERIYGRIRREFVPSMSRPFRPFDDDDRAEMMWGRPVYRQRPR